MGHRIPRDSGRIAALEVENWNLKYAVGTPVMLTKDSGTVVTTKTRSRAEVAASGHAVIWLEGISGYYLLDRVRALGAAEVEEPR